jgi:fructokinase
VITVMGEALVDLIIDANGDVGSVVGGAELNAARTMARLGVPVDFLGGISGDPMGLRIARSLASDGIGRALGNPTSEPTTLAIATIDADGAASYRFLFAGTSALAVTPAVALAAIPDSCTMLHIGGTALLGLPFAGAAIAVVEASPPDLLVMFDPNCRPVIPHDASAYRAVMAEIGRRADIVKASTEDLDYMFPGQNPNVSARELQRTSGALVLVTDATRPLRIFQDETVLECPVPQVEVVDTVGAGDSFGGGFLAWWYANGFGQSELSSRELVMRAAEVGLAVAAVNCTRSGANPPTRAELGDAWLAA